MTDAIPPKNPRFRSLVSLYSEAERERKVRYFVEQSKLPPFFSVIRKATGIPDKQLAGTLNSLAEEGFHPVLRWVDLNVPPPAAHGRTTRDIGHVSAKLDIGFPQGSGGWLWAIDLIDLVRERPRTRREILNQFQNKERIAAGRHLSLLLRERVLVSRPVATGKRGRPRLAIGLVAP